MIFFTAPIIIAAPNLPIPVKKSEQNRGFCATGSTEESAFKAPPIKKRRLTETNVGAPAIQYISPLESQSPIGTLKRKPIARKSVRFDDAADKVQFLKPAIPALKPPPIRRPVHHSKHVDKGSELSKVILQWNPEWFKTMKPEINGVNPTLVPILNNFESHDDYKK